MVVLCWCCSELVEDLAAHHHVCRNARVHPWEDEGATIDLTILKLRLQLRKQCLRLQNLGAAEARVKALQSEVLALKREVQILKGDLADRTISCSRCGGTSLDQVQVPDHGIFEYSCRKCQTRFRAAG